MIFSLEFYANHTGTLPFLIGCSSLSENWTGLLVHGYNRLPSNNASHIWCYMICWDFAHMLMLIDLKRCWVGCCKVEKCEHPLVQFPTGSTHPFCGSNEPQIHQAHGGRLIEAALLLEFPSRFAWFGYPCPSSSPHRRRGSAHVGVFLGMWCGGLWCRDFWVEKACSAWWFVLGCGSWMALPTPLCELHNVVIKTVYFQETKDGAPENKGGLLNCGRERIGSINCGPLKIFERRSWPRLYMSAIN